MFNKSMWKRVKDQAGMVLPMAILLMVVASFIVMPGLFSAGTAANINRELESSTMGYYAAKAGIEDSCYTFRTTGAFSVGELPDPVNNMKVELLLDPPAFVPSFSDELPQFVTVISTASDTVTGVPKATISANVKIYKSPGSIWGELIPGTGYWTPGTSGSEGYWIPGTDPVWIPGTPGTPDTPGTPGVNGYPFDYAVATTGGLLWIKNNANVNSIPNPPNGEADVFANGELRKDTATGFINGAGYYTEGTSDCTNITGGCEKVEEGITFQTLDKSWYWAQAQLGKAYPAPSDWPNTALPTTYGTNTYIYDGEKNAIKLEGTSNWVYISTVKNPTYLGGAGNISYINGNLKLEKKFLMKGVLWVNGTISIEGLTYIYTDPTRQSYLLAHGAADHGITLVTNSKIMATNNNLNLMSDDGYITLESGIDGPTVSAPVLIGILYAPNGTITINSNSDAVTSAILGKSVTLDANVMVNYDTALRDNPPEGFELNVTPIEGIPGTDPTEGYWIAGTEPEWVPEIPATAPVYHVPGAMLPDDDEVEYLVIDLVIIDKYSGQ